MSTPSLTSLAAALAPALFQGNGNDTVASPDVYGISSTQVINTPVGKFNDFDGSLLGNLKSSYGGIGSLVSLGSVGNQLGNLTSRLNSSLGGLSLSALPVNLQGALTQNLRGMGNSNYANVAVNLNGSMRTLRTNDLDGANASLGLLNTVTTNSRYVQVQDTDASAAALSGSLQYLINNGMGDAIPGVLENVSSPAVANAALRQCVPTALAQGDIGSLSHMVTTLGPSAIRDVAPNAGRDLVSSYRIPANLPRDQYAAQGSQMVGLLNQLDPQWDSYSRNGSSVGSLSYFSQASDDTLTVLGTQSAYSTHVKLARGFSVAEPKAALKQQFPYMLQR